jgi:hypothetical protein
MRIRTAAIAALLAFDAIPAAAVTLPALDPNPIDLGAVSQIGDPANIEFINDVAFPVSIYWINYSGDRVFYQSVGPNQSYVQPTFITHPWLVVETGTGESLVQGSGHLLAGFYAATPFGQDTAIISGFRSVFDDPAAAPEPATWVMMFLGFGVIGLVMRRKRPGVQLAAPGGRARVGCDTTL